MLDAGSFLSADEMYHSMKRQNMVYKLGFSDSTLSHLKEFPEVRIGPVEASTLVKLLNLVSAKRRYKYDRYRLQADAMRSLFAELVVCRIVMERYLIRNDDIVILYVTLSPRLVGGFIFLDNDNRKIVVYSCLFIMTDTDTQNGSIKSAIIILISSRSIMGWRLWRLVQMY